VNEAATTPGTLFVTLFRPSHGKCGDGTLLFFYLAGFQGFTDHRCFHVCKKPVTFEGVTKEVGVVECKPDAAFPTWGDTTGERGKPVLKYNSQMHWLQLFIFTVLGMQVLSSHL